MKERVWVDEVCMAHQRKWIIMTHLEWEKGTNKLIGEVHSVVDTFDEALELERSLDDSYGKTSVFEGFDPRPMIGGLFRA